MHILVVNDDGPPSNQSSPYVHSFVSALEDAGHQISVILPDVQRSWIGKAHMVGQTLTPTYYRPGNILQDDGVTSDQPFDGNGTQWILVDGTPASCVQIGLYHVFKDRGPIDLVVSGPNYGRNTTALFALSSGTIGGALEGCVNGKKSIALSYAFDSREHDKDIIAAASRLSTKLIERFMTEWPEDVHLYSINVPLRPNVEKTKIIYTDMIQNRWQGSSFQEMPASAEDADPNTEEYKIRKGDSPNGDVATPNTKKMRQQKFKWAPNFADVKQSVEQAGQGDGWAVVQGYVSVTPLKANFWHLPQYKGEIKLGSENDTLPTDLSQTESGPIVAYIDYPDAYVQPLLLEALADSKLTYSLSQSSTQLEQSSRTLQIAGYESLNFDHVMENPSSSFACAYVIRKALIRKHFLSNTVSTWLVKHPESLLASHFKPGIHFELDFSEFLDEALVDAWDLNESLARNLEAADDGTKEWWILKPGMSDGGNGIRLFSTFDELQAIFEEWDEDEAEDDTDGGDDQEQTQEDETQPSTQPNPDFNDSGDKGMTSQLRHFIVQPYIGRPLLLEEYGNRKFHLRVYVLAVGALKVYVYKEMLALFASKPYQAPLDIDEANDTDLAGHLTNTCFQDEETKHDSVHQFWKLQSANLDSVRQEKIFGQICGITGEVFQAAAQEQMVHFQTLPNAFEIFGVDYLIDSDANVWLLELNAYPDFRQTGSELQDVVVGNLFREVVDVAVVPFFDESRKNNSEGTGMMQLVKDIDLGRR